MGAKIDESERHIEKSYSLNGKYKRNSAFSLWFNTTVRRRIATLNPAATPAMKLCDTANNVHVI